MEADASPVTAPPQVTAADFYIAEGLLKLTFNVDIDHVLTVNTHHWLATIWNGSVFRRWDSHSGDPYQSGLSNRLTVTMHEVSNTGGPNRAIVVNLNGGPGLGDVYRQPSGPDLGSFSVACTVHP